MFNGKKRTKLAEFPGYACEIGLDKWLSSNGETGSICLIQHVL